MRRARTGCSRSCSICAAAAWSPPRSSAQWLEVSERTIYRDIADLQSTGVPIDGEAGVGYMMREGFDLPPLMFTRDEIVALVAGARMVRAFGGAAMARAADEALVKIGAVLPDTREATASPAPRSTRRCGWSPTPTATRST